MMKINVKKIIFIIIPVIGMLYSMNAQSYSYRTNYRVRYQRAYVRSNGTYVRSHYKTVRNKTNWDNFSTRNNYNPYNGRIGHRAKDYSSGAYNYGRGRTIYTGSGGGQYYYNSRGRRTYVPKRYILRY